MAICDASGTVAIAADPGAVYDIVTDLDALGELAEEAHRMRWVRGHAAAAGSVFRGANRHGPRRWSTTCTVLEAQRGRRFSFDVDFGPVPIARWTYDFAAAASGCVVDESVTDRRPPLFWLFAGLATGRQDRAAANRANIAATLRRLKARVEGT